MVRLDCDARAASFFGLCGFAAAGRAGLSTTVATIGYVSNHNAPFAVGCEERNLTFGSIALALRAVDRGIGVSYGAQGVELMATVHAKILINRHEDHFL